MKRIMVGFSVLLLLVLANTGFGQGACINPYGTLRLSKTSLSFGSVNLGASISKSFTITNPGFAGNYLEVDTITSDNPQFKVQGVNLPVCVAGQSPGRPNEPATQTVNSLIVTVVYTPTAAGSSTGHMTVHTSDMQTPNIVSLSGSGIASGKLSINPQSIDFGTINTGQTATRSFVLSNTGQANITVQRITSDDKVFGIVSPAFPVTLGPKQSVTVNAVFHPTFRGSVSAIFSITAPDGRLLGSVAATGRASQSVARIRLSVNALDFGTADIGTFRARNVTIFNDGGGDLTVQAVLLANAIVKPAALTVAPGHSAVVQVRFIFQSEGSNQVTLSLKSNDTDHPQTPITLTGTGRAGKLGFLNMTSGAHIKSPMAIHALQWIDFNVDGKQDLYLCGQGGNLLFKNQGNNHFQNVTNAMGLQNTGRNCTGATWGDVDNDGDPDLFIANAGAPSMLCRNNKTKFTCSAAPLLGVFEKDSAPPQASGGIWFDFNNDGLLDLYIVRDGQPNMLLKNQGLFHFVNVASSAHVAVSAIGRGAVAADFNNDGFQDLYVVNYQSSNKLLINNKNETFRDVTGSAKVGFSGSSQQAVVADYNRDGKMDLFVANADGSSIMYKNMGQLKFQNVTSSLGLAGPVNVRSASFSDYDNDGDEDLILATVNGNFVYRNNITRFTRMANVDLSNATNPTGTVTGDANGDGQPDVAIGDGNSGQQNGNSLYQNTGGAGNHWLTLVLQGTASNRSAIGAKVVVRAGVSFQAKMVSGGNGQNQDSLPLEFGLGAATQADQILINWPSGKIQVMGNVAADQTLTIVEQ